MRVRILGPVEVIGVDGPVRGLERKARELLAVLTLRLPGTVAIDELVGIIWDEPPPSAVKTVQAHLSRLRAALATTGAPTDGLERAGTSYRLRVDAASTDIGLVEDLRVQARRAQTAMDHDAAAELLGQARRQWRGDVELPATVAGAALAARCHHLREQLVAEHLSAMVAGTGPGDAVAELRSRTTADPLAEPDWALLVTALGRIGQRSSALRAFQSARTALADVGLEPGSTLRDAERAVLSEPEPPRPRPTPTHGRGPSTGDGDRRGDAPSPSPTVVASPDTKPSAATVGRAPAEIRYTPAGGPAHQIAFSVIGPVPPRILLLNPGLVSIDGLYDEAHLAHAVDALVDLGGLVTFDRRGMGLSDRSGPQPPAGVDTWVDDAVAVLTAIGTIRPTVVANADSCLVALALAAHRPDLVGALVLVHPYARYLRASDYPYGYDPTTASAMSSDVLALDDRAARFDPLSHIAPSVAADPGFRSWWDALGRRAASPGAAAALHRAIFDGDVRSLLPDVVAPTLLVHRQSCASYDVGHLRHLAEAMPAATTATLPGADELWFVGDTDGLVAAVRGFAPDLGPEA